MTMMGRLSTIRYVSTLSGLGRNQMLCPNCKHNTLRGSPMGEYCSRPNTVCGYIDGMVFKSSVRKKPFIDGMIFKSSGRKKPLTELQRAREIIRALERTVFDLKKRLWNEEHKSCGYCGMGPSHPADGC